MLEGINWLAVIVAALAFYALGAVWYSALFGKKWAELCDIDWENPGGNMALIFGSTLVLEVIACAVLATIINASAHPGWQAGLHYGLVIGIGIVTPVITINYLYQRKKAALVAIDAGHMTLGLAIAGLILGLWR